MIKGINFYGGMGYLILAVVLFLRDNTHMALLALVLGLHCLMLNHLDNKIYILEQAISLCVEEKKWILK